MRRKYQQGHVYQKGRQKSDPWLPSDRPTYDSGATLQEKLTQGASASPWVSVERARLPNDGPQKGSNNSASTQPAIHRGNNFD